MKTIYLAGAITGLSKIEMENWRITLKDIIEDVTSKKWICINPCDHIPSVVTDKVERECMEWDIWKVKHSDLIVCDYDHPNSIGTTWELAVARECGIPIIGLKCDPDIQIHPWWRDNAIHISNSIDDLCYFLCTNYLNED